MGDTISGTSTAIINFYNNFIDFFPPSVGEFFNFLILVFIVMIYAIFIWKFYKFISKKTPLGLTLNKYQKSEQISSHNLIKATLYFLEYIILLPFIIFMIFVVFTFFLLVLSQGHISQILMISAVVIASIRVASYYKEELAQDIAKLLPLTLLGVAVLNPNNFTQTQYFENVLTQLNLIPSFLSSILSYLAFIVILEATLRFFDFVFSLLGIQQVVEDLEN